MKLMTVGEFSAQAGIGRETVRYYERRGLLPRPPRGPQGYRQYTAESLARVAWIRRARQLGFSLRQIQALLHGWRPGRIHCALLRTVALDKLADMDRRIAELQGQRRALRRLLAGCPDESAESCPVIIAHQP